LVLAFSFGTYGLLKKKANAGAVESLAVDTGVLLLPMSAYLVVLSADGATTFGQRGVGHALLLLQYGEPMATVRLLGFALVWAALIIFTADSLTAARRRQLQLAVESVG
jgi:EamA domain-containing membrane protein RarD